MKPGLQRTLLVEALRYLALTQAGAVVVLHGAWIVLALAVVQHVSTGLAPGAEVSRTILRAFVWLGGTDGQGVGSASSLLVVWGKISVALYLLDAVSRALIGPRTPIRLRVLALASGVVALLGYGVSFFAADGGRDTISMLLLALLLSALAAAGMAWAVLARRIAEATVRRIEMADVSVTP